MFLFFWPSLPSVFPIPALVDNPAKSNQIKPNQALESGGLR
jgi:hypothetical protein